MMKNYTVIYNLQY